jgi:regulator of protease activity HflC (stomatin/prohibitin superfamily)
LTCTFSHDITQCIHTALSYLFHIGICNEILKAVVAQKDAAELLTQRDQVSLSIRESLRARAHDFNIELDDVSITHLAFSREFSKAIEDKQVAEQMAERAKFIVKQRVWCQKQYYVLVVV